MPTVNIEEILDETTKGIPEAISHFWGTRSLQEMKQGNAGLRDQGARCAVTGGKQMDGFVLLITGILIKAGIDPAHIFCRQCLELPGYFRSTKQWDIIVVRNGQLIAAIEAKSQVGPSFGNNFNNRTEEAIGSALDLWTAFREGAFNSSVRPWLGYIFLLEDCPRSRQPVMSKTPHFKVFPEFDNASYMQRYEWFCRKLVREQLYNASSLLVSDSASGDRGSYSEPAKDLRFNIFARSLLAHALSFGSAEL